MTQEDKELLLKDLSARLHFGVKICYAANHKINGDLVGIVGENAVMFSSGRTDFPISVIRPYLRPMSSMNEKEFDEYESIKGWREEYELIDWLNAHHFDYRNLIERGLAIEVTEGNNPYKE